jgi:hypothetical protein
MGNCGLPNNRSYFVSQARSITPRFWVLTLMILAAASLRLLPGPANFAAGGALALFAGASFADRRLGVAMPLLALFVSDLGIEVLYRLQWSSLPGIYPEMWTVYICYALIAVLGWSLRQWRHLLPVASAAVAASLLFFLITNFFVWLLSPAVDAPLHGYYLKNWDGLMLCYDMGLPFFRNTFLSDLLFTPALFAGLWVLEAACPQLRQSAAQPMAASLPA